MSKRLLYVESTPRHPESADQGNSETKGQGSVVMGTLLFYNFASVIGTWTGSRTDFPIHSTFSMI
jgi:hypothetical protein